MFRSVLSAKVPSSHSAASFVARRSAATVAAFGGAAPITSSSSASASIMMSTRARATGLRFTTTCGAHGARLMAGPSTSGAAMMCTSSASSSSFSVQRRHLSQVAAEASRHVPKTPEGQNPYTVLKVDLKQTTTMDQITKLYKGLAKEVHPDRDGGSHEKMAEVNAAHKILKENHGGVIKGYADAEALLNRTGTKAGGRARPGQRGRTVSNREEEYAKTGGVAGRSRTTDKVRDINQRKTRSPKEVEKAWKEFQTETQDKADRMVNRFEVALEQCLFFKKTSLAAEIAVRERWLRKTYIKSVWEEVHELRGGLLKRGARNVQQAEMAEDMVAFASAIQKKLNDDFARQAQQQLKGQIRIFLKRCATLGTGTVGLFVFVIFCMSTFWRNSFAVRFKEAIMGIGG